MNAFSQTDSLVLQVGALLSQTDQGAAGRYRQAVPYDNGESHVDEMSRLNRYWRVQLCGLSINTISERGCLMDGISPCDWLRHFKGKVLPTIQRFNLPSAF